MKKIIAVLAMLAVVFMGLMAPATAGNGQGQDHPAVCHPVGGATGGNLHNGYSLIAPDKASSHIDESLYPDGHYWKHEHDGRHDVYYIDGKCDDGSVTPPSDYPYEVSACWEVTDWEPGDADWPQTYVGQSCPNTPECDDAHRYQFDKYWIRDDADKQHFEDIKASGLDSPADDSSLEPHDYYMVTVNALPEDECTPPEKPQPVVTETSSTEYLCGDAFSTVTTTTTTTDWVLEDNEWVPGEPVVSTTTEQVAHEVVPCGHKPPHHHKHHNTPPDKTVTHKSVPTVVESGLDSANSTSEPDANPFVLGGVLLILLMGTGAFVAARRKN